MGDGGSGWWAPVHVFDLVPHIWNTYCSLSHSHEWKLEKVRSVHKYNLSLIVWSKNVFIGIWISRYWRFVMKISVTVSSKLVFSKRVIFAFEKNYFEKDLSNWVESMFCVLSIELFHPVHCVEVMHWNVCWIFCIRFSWSPFNVFLTF